MVEHSRTRIERYAPREDAGTARPDEPYVDLYLSVVEGEEVPLSCAIRRGNPDVVATDVPDGIPVYPDELEGLILQLQDVHRRLNPGIEEVEDG